MSVLYFTLAQNATEVNIALLLTVLVLIQYMITNFLGGKLRKTAFSEEFMKENFEEEHSRAFTVSAEGGENYQSMPR